MVIIPVIDSYQLEQTTTPIDPGLYSPLALETELRQVLPAPNSSFAFRSLQNAGRKFFPEA